MTYSRTRTLLSWSGGKDAAWALHVLRQRRDIEVIGLVTTVTDVYERISMQGIRTDILHAQADAAGLQVLEARIPPGADNATYEAAFSRTLQQARERWDGVDAIAFGDLFLADIRSWRETLCKRLGWTALFPLFGSDTRQLAGAMIAGGLRANICCVDTTQLDAGYAGRAFDQVLLAALPEQVDPCGENGEFHTCAWDGPMFERPILVECGETVLRDDRFAYTDFMLAPSAAGRQSIKP